MKRTLLAITFSYASSGIIYADSAYVAPQAVKIMFHVDKLPIDQGMRKRLSKHLMVLAQRKHDGSAFEHRLTAQVLMLAMRVDRENTSAIKLNKNLAKGGKLPVSNIQAKVKALKKLRSIIELLSKTEEDSEARVLETYLKDVFIGLDKNSPLSDSHEQNNDRWDGIVPAFDKKRADIDKPDRSRNGDDMASANAPNLNSSDTNEVEPVPPEPDKNEKSQEFVNWTTHSSGIKTPLTLFKKLDEDRVEYRFEIVTMNTQIFPRVKMESNLSLELKPWADEEQIEIFESRIDPLMKTVFGKYESVKVEITTSGSLSERSKTKILLPLFLQLKASQNNIQIREGICVMGRLSKNMVTRDSNFWQTLKLLRNSDFKNHRLLVPSNAEIDLKQLIALEEEDFFVRNEVLVISNIDESMDFIGKTEKSAINEASDEFAKIQAIIGTKSVGAFAVNKQVRSKLEEILTKNPNHLSAKMILLRGDASRPRKLDRYFIADELNRLLKKTSFINKRTQYGINVRSLASLVGKIEVKVAELEPFLNVDDRELTSYLNDVKDDLETLLRAKGKLDKRESAVTLRGVTQGLGNFKINYAKAKNYLGEILSKPPKN